MSQQTTDARHPRRTNGGGGLFTFLVGIAAGAAAGYYLSTEEGRRLRSRLGEHATTYGSQANALARDGSQRANENLRTAIRQGREYVNDLSATVKTRVDDLSATAKTRLDETGTTARARAHELGAVAKQKASELSETARAKAHDLGASAKSKADQTSSSFQEGVARGRARLDRQRAEIDNLVSDDRQGDASDPAADN